MSATTARVDASTHRLPLLNRAILGVVVAVLALTGFALPATVLFAWLIHFRRLPDWLINVVGVIVVLGVFFAAWRTTRFSALRRFRFSLRFALLWTTLFTLEAGILAHRVQLLQREHKAVRALWEDGSYVNYNLKRRDSDWFRWLIRRYGHDPFIAVSEVYLKTDRGVDALLSHQVEFAGVEIVCFASGVTDQGLEVVSEFTRFSNLKVIELSSGGTDASLGRIKQLSNVACLGLVECNKITDDGLSNLIEMHSLKELVLVSESTSVLLTDAGLKYIGKMRQLKTLNILGLPITDAGLDHLVDLKDLQILCINRAQITRRGIERLQRELPTCHILSDAK